MKKYIWTGISVIALLACMCGCGAGAVNMDEGSSDIAETSAKISDDYVLQKMNDEAVEKLVELGNNAEIKGGSNYLNVSLYTQTDSRWKDEPLGDSTMQYAGSEVTSFAMVMKYYKGASHTPLTVLQTMGSYQDGINLSHAGENYNVSCAVIEGKTSDEYISAIIGLIDVARPAIIGLRSEEDTHFVVAYGYNKDTIFINDPADRYSTLQEYFNDAKGYNVYEVINCYPNE